jgi:hypothetical protein
MSREDRKKASDVFHDSEFVFSRKIPFNEAFPQIKSAKVRVEESGYSPSGMYFDAPNIRIYDEKTLGEYINCSNRHCYNGGFSIGQILREMVQQKKSHDETTRICQGYEGSPKGKKRYRSCVNYFKISVDIEYNP